MKKSLVFVVCGILLLLLPLAGCLPSNTSSQASNPVVYKSDLDAFKIQVTNDVNSALKTEHDRVTNALEGVDDNEADINALQSKVNNLSSPDMSAYIRKSELQQWLTDNGYKKASTSSSSGSTTGDYGQLIDEDGDLELWLDRVSGAASDELRTRDGKNEARFDFVVVNKDADSAHDFKIYLEFEPDIDVVLDITTTYATASGSLTYIAVRSPNSDKGILRIDPTNTGRILKDDAEDYTIWLTVEQSTNESVDWNMSFRIDDRD